MITGKFRDYAAYSTQSSIQEMTGTTVALLAKLTDNITGYELQC